MLKPVGTGSQVVVCTTCRRAEDERAADGARCGARLAQALHDAARDSRYAGVAVVEMPCLFACTQGCTAHVRAPGRIGYVFGGFAPGPHAAHGLLDYALAHAETTDGVVAWSAWPEAVKGHVIVRVPPEGFVAA